MKKYEEFPCATCDMFEECNWPPSDTVKPAGWCRRKSPIDHGIFPSIWHKWKGCGEWALNADKFDSLAVAVDFVNANHIASKVE